MPVLDPALVGQEPVVHAPENCLGPAVDVDLAVEHADVGLDGVGTEVGQRCDLGVVLALGDEGEDRRLTIGEPLPAVHKDADDGLFQASGIIGSIIGAVIALLIRQWSQRRSAAHV
jgi:hypothetical protein